MMKVCVRRAFFLLKWLAQPGNCFRSSQVDLSWLIREISSLSLCCIFSVSPSRSFSVSFGVCVKRLTCDLTALANEVFDPSVSSGSAFVRAVPVSSPSLPDLQISTKSGTYSTAGSGGVGTRLSNPVVCEPSSCEAVILTNRLWWVAFSLPLCERYVGG